MDLKEYNLLYQGKIRDIYDYSDDLILIVTTDKISVHNKVLDFVVPNKGMILTKMSIWWSNKLKSTIPHHFYNQDIINDNNAIICRKLNMLPIECIVRGYINNKKQKEYSTFKTIDNIDIDNVIIDNKDGKLKYPIFTPHYKGKESDTPISFDKLIEYIGKQFAYILKSRSILIYNEAFDIAKSKGIIIKDIKLEFGLYNNIIYLGDEIITPDSARFWDPVNNMIYDKEYLRNIYNTELIHNKQINIDNIISELQYRYQYIYDKLVGE